MEQKKIDISNMTILELKALVYDFIHHQERMRQEIEPTLKEIENVNKNIQIVNSQILKLEQEQANLFKTPEVLEKEPPLKKLKREKEVID